MFLLLIAIFPLHHPYFEGVGGLGGNLVGRAVVAPQAVVVVVGVLVGLVTESAKIKGCGSVEAEGVGFGYGFFNALAAIFGMAGEVEDEHAVGGEAAIKGNGKEGKVVVLVVDMRHQAMIALQRIEDCRVIRP